MYEVYEFIFNLPLIVYHHTDSDVFLSDHRWFFFKVVFEYFTLERPSSHVWMRERRFSWSGTGPGHEGVAARFWKSVSG